MKNWSVIMAVMLSVCSFSCSKKPNEVGFVPLFDGQSFSDWTSVREESNGRGSGCFSVNENESAIHVYADKEAGSEQPTDCLISEKAYSDYVLKLEYKWLENRFAPRVDNDRDAGLLFHIHDNMQKIWPDCIEMQLGESDEEKIKDRYVTGDLWVIGEGVQAMNERDANFFYSPGSDMVAVGKGKMYDKSFIAAGNEKPHGEWNEITLTVRGGREAVFELNGKVVNRIENFTYMVDEERLPLTQGHIGLQAEFAELMYRNIRIKELPSQSAH